jgi:glutamyl-tRNA(Gln) amidotransferase subunit D
MTTANWQQIAKEVEKEYKRGAKGIVLMHGTDTMHYTSAALSFMVKTPVPVVLVGAQRSSDRGSSDNKMNLLSAVIAAESDIAEVSVCMHASMNDDFCHLHRGTKVRKLHTSRRDAFQSVNVRPLARISPEDGKIETLDGSYKKRSQGKLEIDPRINPNVGSIYTYPGISTSFIEKLGDQFDGVVIAGTGLGHVPKTIRPAVKELIENGIPVVIAPQTIFGRLNLNVYTAGRELLETGVIGNYCDWTPETATVKLMIALGRYKKMEDIREFMQTNIAGEISARSEVIQ